MPSVLKLIDLLRPDRLLYIGLTNTQLTLPMVFELIQPLLKRRGRDHIPPGNHKKVLPRLELQSVHAFQGLTAEDFDKITAGLLGVGIEIKWRRPKPHCQSRDQLSRASRWNKREALKNSAASQKQIKNAVP